MSFQDDEEIPPIETDAEEIRRSNPLEGADEARPEILALLQRHAGSSEIEGSCVVVLNWLGSPANRRVARWEYSFHDVQSFTDEILERACDDVTSHGYRCKSRYEIMLHIGGKQPRVGFSLLNKSLIGAEDGTGDGSDYGFDDNVATGTMVAAFDQSSRHTEVFARLVASMSGANAKLLLQLYNAAQVKIDQLEQKIEDYRDREDGVRKTEWARQLYTADLAKADKRREVGTQIALALLPALAGKVMGIDPSLLQGALGGLLGPGPGAAAPPGAPEGAPSPSAGEVPPAVAARALHAVGAMANLLESLRPDQLQVIQTTLDAQQIQLLMVVAGDVEAIRGAAAGGAPPPSAPPDQQQPIAEPDFDPPSPPRSSNANGYRPYNPFEADTAR